MRNRRSFGIVALVIAFAGALVLWQTAYWARTFVMSDITQRSGDILDIVVENLRGELGKFQYQPRLLAADPALGRALSNDASAADVARARDQLVHFNDVSGATGTYLLDVSGRTVIVSDSLSPKTSVGQNFSYRPYFKQALQGSLGRDFAFDPQTGERSYYFAHPIRSGTRILGAVAIKVAVDRLEPSWSSSDFRILVVDSDGVIFLSSHPEWRFRSLDRISEEAKNRLILARTYGARDIVPLPVTDRTDDGMLTIQDTPWATAQAPRAASSSRYLITGRSMAEAGWRVLILSDTRSVAQQVNIWSAIAAFMMVSLLLLAANIYQRRRRYVERMALQETAQIELEHQVSERTTDLTQVNTQLRTEIAERQKTETQLRRTQAELVQATKLAALGQLSAGLSHELNQPLAAIRSYSDNAVTYIDREQPEQAQLNLRGISELTARMGRIIKNLRTYARDEPIALRAVSVTEAINEALTLLDARITAESAEISVTLPDDDIRVTGGSVRLQQVFVNLVSNALDAMRTTVDKKLYLSVDVSASDVCVIIRDSGPGFAGGEVDKLFDPFFSTKEVGEGMGLGLSITYGIVKQFGGEISARNHEDGGAEFTLTLRRIGQAAGEAA